MSYGIHVINVSLNSSGAGSATKQIEGILNAIRVERSSGTPTVTVADSTDTFLDGVSVASDTTYHPAVEQQDNAGAGQGLYMPYIATGEVTVTVASGATDGTVTVFVKVV